MRTIREHVEKKHPGLSEQLLNALCAIEASNPNLPKDVDTSPQLHFSIEQLQNMTAHVKGAGHKVKS